MRAESSLQSVIMTRLRLQHPELVAVAIPNGTWFFGADKTRAAIMVRTMKRDGLMTPGASDIVLAGSGRVAFIEIKTPAATDLLGKRRQAGRLNNDQQEFSDRCAARGVAYFVARSYEDVEDAISTVWRTP